MRFLGERLQSRTVSSSPAGGWEVTERSHTPPPRCRQNRCNKADLLWLKLKCSFLLFNKHACYEKSNRDPKGLGRNDPPWNGFLVFLSPPLRAHNVSVRRRGSSISCAAQREAPPPPPPPLSAPPWLQLQGGERLQSVFMNYSRSSSAETAQHGLTNQDEHRLIYCCKRRL